MLQKEFTIKNKMGFHMRPASQFTAAMAKYSCDITIIFGGNRVNGKSVMNIIAACIKCGSTVTVQTDGADETAALNEAATLIENGFGEE